MPDLRNTPTVTRILKTASDAAARAGQPYVDLPDLIRGLAAYATEQGCPPALLTVFAVTLRAKMEDKALAAGKTLPPSAGWGGLTGA